MQQSINLKSAPAGIVENNFRSRVMATKPINVIVKPRGKPIRGLPDKASIYLQSNTADLYHRLAAESGCSPHRLRLTKGSDGSLVPNSKEFTVERTGLRNDSVVNVKDLGNGQASMVPKSSLTIHSGPQLDWQLVYVIEYLGPLIIVPLTYFLRPYIFANAPSPSLGQTMSCILITLHFLKREYETLFIHRFSSATMPAKNIFKNSAHYWLLGGANIAFWTFRTGSPAEKLADPVADIGYMSFALMLFIIGEVGNLNAHLVLRNLRPEGTKQRGIPVGEGFDLVTCPNYMFETIAWLGIWVMTWNWSPALFLVPAVGQMAVWARKKEARYRKEFGDKYQKKRFSMLPGII